MDMIHNGYKWCYSCSDFKILSEFSIDRSRFDGKVSKCKNCVMVKERIDLKGRVSNFKGKHHSEKTKRKLRDIAMGRKSPMHGRKHTKESRKKMSDTKRETYPRGEKSVNWKGGSSERRKNDRRKPEYKDWRIAVFERDGYTCKICGDSKGGNLNAHHIKSYSKFPELRLDISNGVTVCKNCHNEIHSRKQKK